MTETAKGTTMKLSWEGFASHGGGLSLFAELSQLSTKLSASSLLGQPIGYHLKLSPGAEATEVSGVLFSHCF